MRRIGNIQVPDWFTAHDARVLGRLRTGMAKDSDIAETSPTFRPIARRIHAAPLADRESVTDDWLRDCSDAEAIRRAVIAIDPAEPVPAPVSLPVAMAVPESDRSPPARVAANLSTPASTTTTTPTMTPKSNPDTRDDDDEGPVACLVCAADIQPLNVEWLWSGRVPLGMLTMFAGDPKLGKSYVTLSMAAAVSRGEPMPFGEVPDGPASTIILSAEDDSARTIVPRLNAAGADLRRIHVLESIKLSKDRHATPNLSADLAVIEKAAADLQDCRLILIDPISSYLGGIDDYRNADLRMVLSPLSDMAERLRAAVVMVSHLSKGTGSNGKHRVMGSIAYVGVCRANFLFVRDPTDPTGRRVLFCDNGGNLAPTAPTLAYTIETRERGIRVEFLNEPVAITTEQALADEVQGGLDPNHAPELRESERWLKEILSAGPLPTKELEESAKKCGFTLRMLKRAKSAAKVISVRQGFGREARWVWKLYDPAEPLQCLPIEDQIAAIGDATL